MCRSIDIHSPSTLARRVRKKGNEEEEEEEKKLNALFSVFDSFDVGRQTQTWTIILSLSLSFVRVFSSSSSSTSKKKQRWLPYEKESGWVLRKSGGMKRKEMNDEVGFFCTMTSFDKIKGKRKEKRMEFSLVNKIQMSCLEKKNQSI